MLSDFYRSREWESFRAGLILERVDSEGFVVCAYCGKRIVKAYDIIGHHKVELTEENYRNVEVSLNPDLVDLVHHKCHNIIHNKLGYSCRQVYIVWGSPLSGKTRWVTESMVEGDLIVDMDNIWQCVSGLDRYAKPNRLKSVVFSVRDNLLESVRYRRGKWNNCYVIGGYPFEAERLRLADNLGARLVHIDTSEEECIRRLEECEDRNKAEWTKYIGDWWLQYRGGY